MTTRLIIFGLFLFVLSCSTNSPVDKKSTNNPRADKLRTLLKKIPILPNDTYTVTFEFPEGKKLYEVDGGTSDSLFFYPMTSIYGLLPDTNHFYSFLSYAPVAFGPLTLTNIDKNGNVIDEKQLSTELYGCGCGYQWYGKVYVFKNRSFLMRDSLITFDCDSLGPQTEDKWKHEIATMTAKVLPDGKINLSRLQRTTVKQ